MGWIMDNLGTIGSAVGSYFGGPVGGTIGGTIGSAIGGNGSKQTGNQTVTQQQSLDPRIDQMLFGGSNGNGPQTGILSQYQNMLGAPQNPQMAQYGQNNLNYLGNSPSDMGAIHDTATGLLNGGQKVSATGQAPAAFATGSMVNAPAQNNLNLSGAYDQMINGNAGANPYLTSALQSGVDQTNASYQQNQTNLTNNLQRNILPGIGSNSVLTGQYGGSRQGIAEGNAISDYTNQLTNSNLQLGLANSANTTGAQAQAFNQGQDRSLAAMQGLGAQQYGVAGQDAATKNATELGNVNTVNNINANWAARDQQAQTVNQQAGMQGAQIGAGLLSGQMNNAYGVGQNQDSYALNQAGKVNSLLTPYLGANSGSTMSQPLYQNSGGNILGGTAASLGLYNQYSSLFNKNNTSGIGTGSAGGGPAGTFFDGYGYIPNGTSTIQ